MDCFLASFEGLSVDQTRQRLKQQAAGEVRRTGNPGEQVIVGLTSSRGAELNGQRVTAIGSDPASHPDPRVQVKTEGGEKLRVRSTNLCVARLHSSEPSRTRMSAKGVRLMARSAVRGRALEDGSDAREGFLFGQRGRYDHLRAVGGEGKAMWQKGAAAEAKAEAEAEAEVSLPPPVPCCATDLCGCLDGLGEKETLIAKHFMSLRPGCYGDGYAHLERMGEGLYAPRGGGLTCSVCAHPQPHPHPIHHPSG